MSSFAGVIILSLDGAKFGPFVAASLMCLHQIRSPTCLSCDPPLGK